MTRFSLAWRQFFIQKNEENARKTRSATRNFKDIRIFCGCNLALGVSRDKQTIFHALNFN